MIVTFPTRNKYKLFCDVETTGFNWLSHCLLTWSGIVTDENLNILAKKKINFRPHGIETWSDEAEEVHGISYYEAMAFPERRKSCIDVLHFLKPFKHEDNWPLTFIEHSLQNIDINFTIGTFVKENLEFSLYKVIKLPHHQSTIKMARKAGYKKNSLDEWAKRIGFNLEHHDSDSDAMACLETYRYLTRNDL